MGGGKVTAGDYKGKTVLMMMGKVYIFLSPTKKIKISSESVESVELVDQGYQKGSVGKAAIGGLMFGAAGAVVGASSTNKRDGIMVDMRFKDGKKSLIRCDNMTYEFILRNCY